MDAIAKKCSCGAVTVSADNVQWSMPQEIFEKEFPMLELEPDEYGNCDYCVNKWGVDLCGCGSGEKVGKCDGEFEECRNNIPAQIIGEERSQILWKF